jgi:CPA2 family monovalent cation:H+ antiporter-2
MESPCSHLAAVHILEGPDEVDGCETCLIDGTHWVKLRMCMTCGVVGCCDDSPGQHAREHAEYEMHPIVRSIEPTETWSYCYIDETIFRVAGAEPVEEHLEEPRSFNHDEAGTRFELWVGSDLVCRLDYAVVGDSINLAKTAVVDGFHGLGYDGELVSHVIGLFRDMGKPIIPSDEFARAYITYRPELHEVVPSAMRVRMFGEQ